MAISATQRGYIDSGTAISKWAERALNMASQSPTLSSRLEALCAAGAAVHRVRQRLFRHLNDVASINRVPNDVLLRILSFVRPEDRQAAAQVCQRWWTISHEAQSLWGYIGYIVTKDGKLERSNSFPAQLPSTPFSLSIMVAGPCDDLGYFLRQHMHRIRSLRVFVLLGFDTDNDRLLLPLISALDEPAPILQILDVDVHQHSWATPSNLHLPSDLLGHAAPLLHSVHIHGVSLRIASRYNSLSLVRIMDISQGQTDFVRILHLYPKLEQLRVRADSLVSGRRQFNPHNLQVLDLPGTAVAAGMVLNRLIITRPLSVWMEYADDSVLRYLLSNAPRQKIRRARFYLLFPTPEAGCALGSKSGITWVLGSTALWAGTLLSNEDIMANLFELCLHELAWPVQYDNLPSVPRLKRLELVLDSFAAPDNDTWTAFLLNTTVGIFYLDGHEIQISLQCPRLEELCIASPGAMRPLTVDVLDVRTFMDQRIRYDASPLPLLTLRNVHLYDQENGRGMQSLTERVSEIVYCDAPVLCVPSIHQRTGSMSWMYDYIVR